jgi:hypothetical protein
MSQCFPQLLLATETGEIKSQVVFIWQHISYYNDKDSQTAIGTNYNPSHSTLDCKGDKICWKLLEISDLP